MNPVFEEAPGTVYNLRATFSLKFATSLGILVCGHADIGGQFPHPLALDFDTLFAVSDMVVQNPAHFEFVRLGCICSEERRCGPASAWSQAAATQSCGLRLVQALSGQMFEESAASGPTYVEHLVARCRTIAPK